ncbi:MAG: (2Fe-2S) ferredoxin domain-containing protein [Spirochaetales bacterium]|nr:(2Fe-2S) ferredoxin domain-containing protein [Spirochaetales bacterium]
MAKLSLEELRKLRDQKKSEFYKNNKSRKDIEIIIGMGTCGIAAGAKDTFDAFVKCLGEEGITNVQVKQTGCMGLCYVEPTVEIRVPDMPDIVYGNVKADVVSKLVHKHIQGKVLLNDHILDKPAADIIKKKEA